VAVAVLLVAGFAFTRIAVRRGEAEFPPEGRFVAVDGVRVHYLERGAGPPVILLHGSPGFLQDFGPTIDALARAHRVIAFDRPGHGYSARPDPQERWSVDGQARILHDAVLRLGVSRPILVGHSWGSTLAMEYALAFPRDVRGLVLLGAVGYPYEPVHGPKDLLRAPVLGGLIRNTLLLPLALPFVAGGVRGAFAPEPVPPGVIERYRALGLRPSETLAIAWDSFELRSLLAHADGRWRAIGHPVVILAGTQDRVANDAPRLARELRCAALVPVPGAGHQLAQLHPGAVAAAVERIDHARCPASD
jgi:pimeloyl-ACP methyl ester carboxylesterase